MTTAEFRELQHADRRAANVEAVSGVLGAIGGVLGAVTGNAGLGTSLSDAAKGIGGAIGTTIRTQAAAKVQPEKPVTQQPENVPGKSQSTSPAAKGISYVLLGGLAIVGVIAAKVLHVF